MLKIFDIISPAFSLDPESLGTIAILILSENTLVAASLGSQLNHLTDIDKLEEGKYYRRVATEFERGLLIGKLLEKYDNAVLFSQRSDVLKRYIPNCEVNQLEIAKEELNPIFYPPYFRPEFYGFSSLGYDSSNVILSNPPGIDLPFNQKAQQKISPRPGTDPLVTDAGGLDSDLLGDRYDSASMFCESLFTNFGDPFTVPPKGYSNTPSKPSSLLSKPQRPRDLYTEIYKDVLEKYADKFLQVPEIRAAKSKSAKAQIRNLADGSIISYRKKYSADEIPSSQEISDLIYEDLIAHGCIDETGLSVEYHDSEICQYFGRRKHKEFVCGLSRQDNSQTHSSITLVFKALSKNLYTYSVGLLQGKDRPSNLGDLTKRISEFLYEETERLRMSNHFEVSDQEKRILVCSILEDMIRNKEMVINAEGDVNSIIRNYQFFGYMDIQPAQELGPNLHSTSPNGSRLEQPAYKTLANNIPRNNIYGLIR
jgi:hypothetical protein